MSSEMFQQYPGLQCGLIFYMLLISAVHMEFIIETLPICGHKQFVEVRPVNIPQIQPGLHTEMSNVTSRFSVGFMDKHLIGNITWHGYNDVSNLYMRLKLFVNEKQEDMKYLKVKHFQYAHGVSMEQFQSVNLSCIRIVPSPNASLMVDVFLLDRKSCDCNQGRQSCYNRCHMFLILQESFPISKVACHVYNQQIYRNHGPLIGVRAERTSENITTFIGQMRNINPYSLVNVWVFSADDPFIEPIATWEFWSNPAGDISFVKTAVSHNVATFFVKVITNCSQYGYQVFYTDDIDYEEYDTSDTVVVSSAEAVTVHKHPMMHHQGSQQNNNLLVLMRTNPELVYGVVAGLAFTACVVAVVMWIKVRPNKCKVPTCSWNQRDPVLCYGEEMHGLNLLGMNNVPPNNQTNDREGENDVKSLEQIPYTMLIHHVNTIEQQAIITNLKAYLTDNDILVNDYTSKLKGNLYDFAEGAGTHYPHIVFILSSALLDLLELYELKKEPKAPERVGTSSENTEKWTSLENEEKWTKLMADRNWNMIPIIVLNTLRILYYDRKTFFRVHLITFSDENHNISNECLQSKFLTLCSGYLTTENTSCYTLKTSDLYETFSQSSGDIQLLIQMLQLRHRPKVLGCMYNDGK